MWAQLGLVQSLILSPVGTVDPVEKNSLELQHVKEAVTPLMIVIFIQLEICTVWLRVIKLKVLKLVRFHMFWSLNSTRSRTFKGGGRQNLPYANAVEVIENLFP